MVHLIGASTSKGYSHIFKFYSQLREKCHNQKHVESQQGFPVDRIQKNIIIIIQIHWLQTYSHPLVYCVYIVVSYFVFAKYKFNNDFTGTTKDDYFQSFHFIRTHRQTFSKMTYQISIKKIEKIMNRKLTQFSKSFVFT